MPLPRRPLAIALLTLAGCVPRTEDSGAPMTYGRAPASAARSAPSTTAAWTHDGTAANDHFGLPVAGVGDVNGDGYDDLMVGSEGYSSFRGAADLFEGSATGLATTTTRTWVGLTPGGWFGTMLDGAGDVNGDGYADVIVGAPYASAGNGRAYVFNGSATGLPASPSATLLGEGGGGNFGIWVDSAGDVNGDGYDDVIVGAWVYGGASGRAYIYEGSATGLSTSPAVKLDALGAGDFFGCGVAGLGDVNGDGYDDVLVGAEFYDGERGGAFLYYGSATGPSTTPDASWEGANVGDELGVTVGQPGDVNGDGYADVAVYDNGSSYAGEVQIFYGSASGPSATADQVLAGATANEGFGFALGHADVDADGYSDLVVGGPKAAYVYAGSASGLDTTPIFSVSGSSYSVAGAGDVDGDGYEDIAVGDNQLNTSTGRAYLYTTEADADGDGYPASTDCDESDAAVNPGATEVCNGVDDDCDGTVDVGAADPSTFYLDGDADGYGDPASTTSACSAPAGYVADATDCADSDGAIHPTAPETCDGVDQDCDGTVDEDATDASTWYEDADGDGYGSATSTTAACAQPSGYLAAAGDCDDTSADAHPGAVEACNGVDDDCDGTTDVDATDALTWYADGDSDGYGSADSTTIACAQPPGYLAVAGDCDDSAATVSPAGVETCDGVDDDCDGAVDEDASDALTWYADADGDGFGDADASTSSCVAPEGYVSDATDCLDSAATVNPAATETCNDIDDDCDGAIDEAPVDPATWYLDADHDGYGAEAESTTACDAPDGYVATGDDCDDTLDTYHPGAAEADCTDPADYNCDGSTGYADSDGDSYAACVDCDDTDGAVNSGAVEVCNGVDDDCDGDVDGSAVDTSTWYADGDADGYGDASSAVTACQEPVGYAALGTDCDDTDGAVSPDGLEVCNGVDDDCDTAIDEDCPADTGSADTADTGSVDTDTGTADTDTGSVDTDTGAADTDTGTVDTDTGSVDTDTGSVDTDTGSVDTDTGSVDTDTDTDSDSDSDTDSDSDSDTDSGDGTGTVSDDTGTVTKGSCGCASTSNPPEAAVGLLGVLLLRRRRPHGPGSVRRG